MGIAILVEPLLSLSQVEKSSQLRFVFIIVPKAFHVELSHSMLIIGC